MSSLYSKTTIQSLFEFAQADAADFERRMCCREHVGEENLKSPNARRQTVFHLRLIQDVTVEI